VEEDGRGTSSSGSGTEDPAKPDLDSSGHPRGLGIRLGVFDPADFSIRSGGVVRLNSRAARHVAELAVTLLRNFDPVTINRLDGHEADRR
jgi:hypothetical protein